MLQFERRGALVPVVLFGILSACVDEHEPDVGTDEQEAVVGSFAARFDDNLRGGGVVAQGASLAGREDDAVNTSATISIAGIPAGATVQRALLYWIISGGSDTGATIDGFAVTGVQVASASTTCWGAVNNATFRADVTSRVAGNGNYVIGGLPSTTVDTGVDTDGAALVVVYQNPASGTRRRVMIRDGAITTNAVSETVTDTFSAVNAPVASTGRFHIVVGDGQAPADGNLVFNGVTLGTNQFPGNDGSLWDVNTYNVTVPSGQASATWTSSTLNPADCLSFGAAVYEHNTAVCGDNLRTGGEACENGNTANGDGCSSTCDVEPGWTCTAGPPSVCTSVCGDGRRVGPEACDDGDTMGGDGCSATCTIEPGWTCTGNLPSVCTTVCGDGIRAGAETCDDGDAMGGDGCSATCAIEPGWTCTGSPSACTTTCGDGIRAGAEACDDGDTMGGDGCSMTCTVEPGWTCVGNTPSVCMTTCGDGVVAGAETCDDGGGVAGDGCSATCTVEPGWTCSGMPSRCTSTCGDGIIAGAETCDDGDAMAGDGCGATCMVEPGWTCTGEPSVCTTTCGDGIVSGAEGCDDGDVMNGDGCSVTCTVEPGWSCVGEPSTCTTTCGDGVVAGSEACDDGGTADGDGCSAACMVEPGWTCDGMPSDCTTICGDGIVTGAELCDDGGSDDGDGCSATCALEANWSCTDGQPTVCQPIGVAGGGCAAGGGEGPLGLAVLLLAGVVGLRRRRRVVAVALVVGAAGPAAAQQIDPGSTGFPAERLVMSTDRAGILDVESARTPGHLVVDLGLWLGYANDPLTLRVGEEHDRLGALVSDRIGGDLVGSVGIGERLQLALSAPIIVAQGQAIGGLMGEELSSFGLGDLRFTPKVGLLRGGTDLAFALAVTAPSSGADDYKGDKGLTAAPQLLLGRRGGNVRLGMNLGWRIREAKRSMDLDIDDELFGSVGAAVRAGGKAELMATVAFATAANAPFGDYNRNHVEGHLGAGIDVSSALRVFAAGGVGVSQGYGTPDWRALAGVWLGAGKAKVTERTVVPVVEEKPVVDLDADRDGVALPGDACPEEKETKNRYQDEDGCPDSVPDTDGDGQNDLTDSCPAVAEDADAFEDDDGCPDPDNDADTVLDLADRCVDEPGVVDNGGCPDTDRDGDGIVDRLDNCPDVAGTEKFHGCKEKQLAVITGDKIELLDIVYFKTNKAILQKRSNKLLNNVANVVKAHPEITRVTVEGHTDDEGEDWYNKDLSQRRAQAVVEYLIGKGVQPELLTPIGYGEEKPLAENTTAKGRAKNRRVEFKVEGIASKVIETTDGTMAPSSLP